MAKCGNITTEFKDLDAGEVMDVAEIYSGNNEIPPDCVRVGPKGYFMHREYIKLAADIYNMPLRPGDIFVTSFQRSGTTMTQELVWLLANNLNYEKAADVLLTNRYAFLEVAMYFDDKVKDHFMKVTEHTDEGRLALDFLSTPATKTLADMQSPRFIKTHLPMSFLPPDVLDHAKVVYMARDPRDVIVSSFHLYKLVKWGTNLKDFKLTWNSFKKDLFVLTPYFAHVKEAWALRHHPNMLFLFYEDYLKDLAGSIRRVAKFLGKEPTEAEMQRLCEHLSIDNFKKNMSVNYEETREIGLLDDKETFIRKGKSGGWREYFDEEMTQEAEHWIKKNLQDTDLRFPSMELF